jgi:Mlc titration factor MtfA (ptsG expression regulator)
MGIFDRLLNAKNRRLAERENIPDELWEWTIDEHRIFKDMCADDESRLRSLSGQFLASKRFTPVDGAEISDRLKVSVASQACLPLLGLDISWYRGFSTIFITPEAYTIQQSWTDEAGVVHEYEEEVAGEAFPMGPVALSIPDIDSSGWGDGYNVVIHEMAHRLDSLDGIFNGRPPLHDDMDGSRWNQVLAEAWEDLNTKLRSYSGGGRAGHRGTSKRRVRIDPYAAESLDEFFAVVCEYFWENPSLLIREYSAVYEQLTLFFRRDPAAWR